MNIKFKFKLDLMITEITFKIFQVTLTYKEI